MLEFIDHVISKYQSFCGVQWDQSLVVHRLASVFWLICFFCVVSGLVSDAFHLTFGCGLLSFSLFAMAASRQKPDRVFTYGYDL